MENENLYRNLVILLKMFKNRPFHLAKYLIDNNAFNNEFIKKIIDNDLKEDNNDKNFTSISKMNDFYNSLIDEPKRIGEPKDKKEIEIELNKKLESLIEEEKYEYAAILRDYMERNNIKRFK